MQPLFDADEFELPRIALITMRVILAPSGTPSWYEVTERASNGTLVFRRYQASAAEWPNDVGYLSAVEAMRQRIDKAYEDARML